MSEEDTKRKKEQSYQETVVLCVHPHYDRLKHHPHANVISF
jgi:hypothetical protein